MKFTAKQYAAALFESLHSTISKDHDKVLDNFVKLLGENGDLKMHPEIEAEYQRIDLKSKGTTLANVTTAHNLSKEAEKDLIKELNTLIKGKVELKKKIDEGLIGGVVVQMEDTIIDASVKKSLENLKTNLEE